MFQRFRKPKSSAAVVPEPPKVAREGPLDRLYQQTCGVTYSDPRTGPIPALGQEIHEEIKRYQSLFSCIRTMPNEIWHTMFEHVVLIVKPGYDQIHAVQTIRLVCRRWESAARKCATLWQNLPLLDLTNIPMSERKEIAFEKATNHLHSYLQRSVNMPISFTFHFWPDLFLDGEGTGRWTRRGEAMEWLQVLYYERERWGEVEFRATRAILRTLSDRIRKYRRLANLTKFSFEIRGVDYPVTPGSTMVETIDLSKAARLKHFTWDTLGAHYGVPYQETLVRLDLPWEVLESFECAVHEDTGTYPKLMEKGKNLRVLKYTSSKLAELPSTPTLLPHLTKLSLCFGIDLPGPTLIAHLGQLTLPALKELEVFWWKDTTSIDFYGTILALVQRSGCSLDRLATENNLEYKSDSQDFKFGNFTKLLYHCKHLTHLDIGYLESAELEILVPDRNVGKKPPLTTLRSLTVRFPELRSPPSRPAPLLGLLQSRTDASRKPPHSHLEDLYVKHHNDDSWRIAVIGSRDDSGLKNLDVPSDEGLCGAATWWKQDLAEDVFVASTPNGHFSTKRQLEVKQVFREMKKLDLEGRDARVLVVSARAYTIPGR
ncbi:hypothetical protein FA13DRAFT_1735595 [Coprinellus micaceus]|uniref:F-box domain-containing protein n=1 Tax=Coprinellus micaceus TaxID=71717 RepID=A0A4Y7T2Q8_COPMI|nr:hypothetical protein FA13DRAFT_1735595 [Coprinellus micaceus]